MQFGKELMLAIEDDWCDGTYVALVVIPFVVGFITFLILCLYAHDAILELANPQYYALHEISQTLGK